MKFRGLLISCHWTCLMRLLKMSPSKAISFLRWDASSTPFLLSVPSASTLQVWHPGMLTYCRVLTHSYFVRSSPGKVCLFSSNTRHHSDGHTTTTVNVVTALPWLAGNLRHPLADFCPARQIPVGETGHLLPWALSRLGGEVCKERCLHAFFSRYLLFHF